MKNHAPKPPYECKQEKIKKLIQGEVIQALYDRETNGEKIELDYTRTVSYICLETSSSKNKVKEILSLFQDVGEIIIQDNKIYLKGGNSKND